MVANEKLAHPSLMTTPAKARRTRATTIAVGASVTVHLIVGAWLFTSTFHPMAPPAIDETPPMVVQTLTLRPKPTPIPTRPPPPRVVVRPSADPLPRTVETVPVRTTLAPEPERTVVAPLALDPPELDPPLQPPAPPKVITDPEWLRRPSAAEVARVYPDLEAREGIGGLVVLACEVTAAGGVTGCAAVSESPAGHGFARAALALTPDFRMKPRTENGQAVGGATVRIPIRFTAAEG